MPSIELRPIAKNPEAVIGYLNTNFRRIADTLALLTNLENDIVSVTGTIEIDTGMAEVYNVFAGFSGPPSSGAAYIAAYPVGVSAPRNITIDVFTNSFAASTTPVDIAWYAIGE